jgi:hypothetical protein
VTTELTNRRGGVVWELGAAPASGDNCWWHSSSHRASPSRTHRTRKEQRWLTVCHILVCAFSRQFSDREATAIKLRRAMDTLQVASAHSSSKSSSRSASPSRPLLSPLQPHSGSVSPSISPSSTVLAVSPSQNKPFVRPNQPHAMV